MKQTQVIAAVAVAANALGGCVTVRPVSATQSVPMTATFEEAQQTAAVDAARVSVLGEREEAVAQCQMPCTASVPSGLRVLEATRPDGARHRLLVGFEPGAWRYSLHYRNQPLYTAGMIFGGIGLAAGSVTGALAPMRVGLVPIVVSGSIAIVFLSVSIGMVVGAGNDYADAVRVGTPPVARRSPATQWAVVPIVAPTVAGAEFALRI